MTGMISLPRKNTIDGLRAIAMTMVIAQHCWLLPFGWTGVWLFFVISGYVITRGFPFTASASWSRWEIFGGFIRRRLIRIVPVYLLYLLVNVLVLLGMNGTFRLWDLPYLLSFVYNWHMIFEFWPGSSGWAPFGHLWTLSVEQQFYLLFPLLMLFVAPALQLRWTIALIFFGPALRLLASALLRQYGSQDPGTAAFAIYASSLLHFDAFLLGSLLARWQRDPLAKARLDRHLRPIALTVAALYAATFIVINWTHGATRAEALRNVFSGILFGQYREVVVYVAVDLLAVAALWYAANLTQPRHWLNGRWLAWVGRVSYGGYLFHALVLWAAGQWLGAPIRGLPVIERMALFAAVWLLTVGLASASFMWFETPLTVRWRRNDSARLSIEQPSVKGITS